MTDKIVHHQSGAISIEGPRATDFYRMATLHSAMGLLEKGLQPTRGFTKTKAMNMATEYTGIPYKRGQLAQAKVDLQRAIDRVRPTIHFERPGAQNEAR